MVARAHDEEPLAHLWRAIVCSVEKLPLTGISKPTELFEDNLQRTVRASVV
jgi:hypothetical protein